MDANRREWAEQPFPPLCYSRSFVSIRGSKILAEMHNFKDQHCRDAEVAEEEIELKGGRKAV